MNHNYYVIRRRAYYNLWSSLPPWHDNRIAGVSWLLRRVTSATCRLLLATSTLQMLAADRSWGALPRMTSYPFRGLHHIFTTFVQTEWLALETSVAQISHGLHTVIIIIIIIGWRVLGRTLLSPRVYATLNSPAHASTPSWGRDCAAGGRAQSFEARFVLVDQVGDASPQADDWWLLVEHVSGLGMDQHEQCVRTDTAVLSW